jgi:DNA-directed RNA polymerase sigma subunit (sigma70/sigma32)
MMIGEKINSRELQTSFASMLGSLTDKEQMVIERRI